MIGASTDRRFSSTTGEQKQVADRRGEFNYLHHEVYNDGRYFIHSVNGTCGKTEDISQLIKE